MNCSKITICKRKCIIVKTKINEQNSINWIFLQAVRRILFRHLGFLKLTPEIRIKKN